MKEGQIFEVDMVTKKKKKLGFPGSSDGKESARQGTRGARESWGLGSSHRRAEETSPRRVSGT